MTKVDRCIPTVKISDFISFFKTFDSTILSVDDVNNTLTIDNNLTIEIVENSGYTDGRDWNLTYGGNTYTCLQQQSEAIWLCCGDNLFWLTVESSDTNKLLVLYEKINDANYCGYAYTAKSGSPNIHNVTIENLSTGDTYVHGKLLNYSSELVYPDCYTYIDYSADTLISNGVLSSLVDTNTFSCSTVTANKIITFNGCDYFAAGTNTVIALKA